MDMFPRECKEKTNKKRRLSMHTTTLIGVRDGVVISSA